MAAAQHHNSDSQQPELRHNRAQHSVQQEARKEAGHEEEPYSGHGCYASNDDSGPAQPGRVFIKHYGNSEEQQRLADQQGHCYQGWSMGGSRDGACRAY